MTPHERRLFGLGFLIVFLAVGFFTAKSTSIKFVVAIHEYGHLQKARALGGSASLNDWKSVNYTCSNKQEEMDILRAGNVMQWKVGLGIFCLSFITAFFRRRKRRKWDLQAFMGLGIGWMAGAIVWVWSVKPMQSDYRKLMELASIKTVTEAVIYFLGLNIFIIAVCLVVMIVWQIRSIERAQYEESRPAHAGQAYRNDPSS